MKQTVNIRLPGSLRDELMSISKTDHVPLSDLVRQSLREFLTIRRFRKIRKKVLPFAEAQGLLTDEDVFKSL